MRRRYQLRRIQHIETLVSHLSMVTTSNRGSDWKMSSRITDALSIPMSFSISHKRFENSSRLSDLYLDINYGNEAFGCCRQAFPEQHAHPNNWPNSSARYTQLQNTSRCAENIGDMIARFQKLSAVLTRWAEPLDIKGRHATMWTWLATKRVEKKVNKGRTWLDLFLQRMSEGRMEELNGALKKESLPGRKRSAVRYLLYQLAHPLLTWSLLLKILRWKW